MGGITFAAVKAVTINNEVNINAILDLVMLDIRPLLVTITFFDKA